jgi:3-oxoacyl-[acyl-carrier-protein] synthase III
MKDGTLKGYMDWTPEEIVSKSILSVKQDVKLLSEYIIPLGGVKLKNIFKERGMKPEDIDYFLPHMSSEFFKGKIFDQLEKIGIPIPYEKWVVNLDSLGNVGAGSVYFMVDELFRSDRLKKGQKILLMVPESSRFSYMYGLLTVC